MIGGTYRFVLIGGPYDGADGLSFATAVDGFEMDLPDLILVGQCDGDGLCNTSRCRGRQHVTFWIPDLEDAPATAVGYELDSTDEFDRDDAGYARPWGCARYVYGSVPDTLRGRQVEMAGAYG